MARTERSKLIAKKILAYVGLSSQWPLCSKQEFKDAIALLYEQQREGDG